MVERLTAKRCVPDPVPGNGQILNQILLQRKNESTAFSSQTVRPSCDLDEPVKWLSRLQYRNSVASKDGAVLRALASHQCGRVRVPGSTPYAG